MGRSVGTERREVAKAGNVAMVLTPPGAGAIAVVRVWGEGVPRFIKACFSKRVEEGRCVHGELRDGVRVIDDPVVVLGAGGAWAEIHVHGGPWVVRRTLDLARRHGFEVRERLEAPLPRNAVDAETILEAEVVEHLPLARTEAALRRLLRQEALWRSEVDTLRERSREAVARRATELLEDRSMHWMLHPPRVAIVGIPNAGKSTLANQLYGREQSITADLPGTTRDWVGEMANINGLAVMLLDTPGVRQTADEIEREAIARSREVSAGADLTVVVLDATEAPRAQVQAVQSGGAVIYVLNKVDQRMTRGDEGLSVIETVATKGEGVERVRAAIVGRFGWNGIVDRVGWWTERQRGVLERAGREGIGVETMLEDAGGW